MQLKNRNDWIYDLKRNTKVVGGDKKFDIIIT